MKSNYSFVNVFQGSGKIDLPKPEGLASKWLFIKAQCGNTTPAAAYPFGKMSLCSYTGGYPTGYGNLCPNSCGEPLTFDAKVQGFTHMHVSGTGGIRAYYNYALTVPVTGNELHPICDNMVCEEAYPGYYSVKLSSGIEFEGTVSQNVAYHRYRFPEDGFLQIDFSNCGLLRQFKGFFSYPEIAEINVLSPDKITAYAKMQGIDLYFAAECKAAQNAVLWQNYEEKNGDKLIPTDLRERFGTAFRVSGSTEMKMAISFVSIDAALSMLDNSPSCFDDAKIKTVSAWDTYLGAIEIETESDELREIFYSNLYHSLIKPCNSYQDSFLYDSNETDGEFYFDFATLWDQYKTALPLIFTLYKNESEGIAKTLIHLTKLFRRSPINVTVAQNNDFPDQARMLAEHVLADYYFRGGEAYANDILEAAQIDLEAQKDFLDTGYCPRYTQILDICEALGAIAQIAHECGKDDIAEKYKDLASHWINAFDKTTGLMSKNSPYYEGTNKSYSFRLLRNMDKRIDLLGKDRFIAELDELFGYTRDAVERPTNPYVDPMSFGIESFEGFNNESDMEIPYAYSYAGRHDKTCEVLRAGMKYMFTTGKGGIPGNNDSGGLSSCYVWNAMGLFPVAGQDLVLIGSPILQGASLKLSNGNILKIIVHNNNDQHIYVERAVFNQKELSALSLSVRELMLGGTLEIYMK